MKREYQQNKLFTLLAMEANHTDKRLAKDNYYALIRVIVKSIARGEKITLPDFGTFTAYMRLPTKGRDINTGLPTPLTPIRVVRFKPCTSLKYYFKNMTVKKKV